MLDPFFITQRPDRLTKLERRRLQATKWRLVAYETGPDQTTFLLVGAFTTDNHPSVRGRSILITDPVHTAETLPHLLPDHDGFLRVSNLSARSAPQPDLYTTHFQGLLSLDH